MYTLYNSCSKFVLSFLANDSANLGETYLVETYTVNFVIRYIGNTVYFFKVTI